MGLPNELGVGRVNRLLQRLLAMKGGAPSPVLVPEIQANLVLEADRPEWEFLGGGSRWAVTRLQAAGGAGTFALVELVNPVGSGVLAVVEAISVSDGTGIQMDTDTGAGIGGTPLAGLPMDRRQQPGRRSALISQILAGASAAALPCWTFEAGEQSIALPVILPQGQLVRVVHQTANVALRANFAWRERALEQSEIG